MWKILRTPTGILTEKRRPCAVFSFCRSAKVKTNIQGSWRSLHLHKQLRSKASQNPDTHRLKGRLSSKVNQVVASWYPAHPLESVRRNSGRSPAQKVRRESTGFRENISPQPEGSVSADVFGTWEGLEWKAHQRPKSSIPHKFGLPRYLHPCACIFTLRSYNCYPLLARSPHHQSASASSFSSIK